MSKLYDYNGFLRSGLIKTALHKAKLRGELSGVSSQKIDSFTEKFGQELSEHKLKIGKMINTKEVEFLIKKAGQNKHDGLMSEDLKHISKVVLNKNFTIK